MVFAPRFEGGVAFEQPVQQAAPAPSAMEAIAGMASNFLRAGASGGGEREVDPRGNFTRSWETFTQAIGQPGLSPLDATGRIRDQYVAFDPRHGDDLLELQEQFGQPGEQLARAQVATAVEFSQTPEGQVASAIAAADYPNDPQAQMQALAEAQLEQAQIQADLTAAAQRIERNDNRDSISEDIWTSIQPQINNTAAYLTRQLTRLGRGLSDSGGISVDQLDEQMQQILGSYGISRIHSGNLVAVGNILKQGVIQGFGDSLREGFGENGDFVGIPPDNYIDDAFATFDSTLQALAQSTDPATEAARLESSGALQVQEALGVNGRAWVAVANFAAGNPVWENILLRVASPELIGVARQMVDAVQNPTSEVDFSSRSVEEAEVTVEIGLTYFSEFTNPRSGLVDNPTARANAVPVMNVLLAAAGRPGYEGVDEEVYNLLSNEAVLAAIEENDASGQTMGRLAAFFLDDFTTDIGALRNILDDEQMGLSFENGRFVLQSPTQVGSMGETLGQVTNENATMLVDSLNSRLEQIGNNSLSTILGEEFEQILAAEQVQGAGTVSALGEGGAGAMAIPEASDSDAREEIIGASEPTIVDFRGEIQGGGAEIDSSTPIVSESGEVNDYDSDFTEGMVWSLHQTESLGQPNNGFGARNNEQASPGTVGGQYLERGHFGRLQFGPARLQEAVQAGVLDPSVTVEQFLASPEIQVAVERWHVNDYRQRIRSNGLDEFIGQTIRGIPITESGMIAAAHLGGFGGMSNFLRSGGADDPNDVYGTSLMGYMARHGGVTGNEQVLTQPPMYSGNAVAVEGLEGVYINRGIAVNGTADASFTMEGASRFTAPNAEEVMRTHTIPALHRLQQYFGSTVAINDAIALDGTGRETSGRGGGPSGSQHFAGTALDIDIRGMSNEEQLRLVRAAYMAGFRGFGFGGGILHVDLGNARSWGYNNSTYGGLPLSEVQAMVASGQFNEVVPPVSEFVNTGAGTNRRGNTIRPSPQQVAAFAGIGPDTDVGEGAPSNYTEYGGSGGGSQPQAGGDPATVNQPAEAPDVTTPAQAEQGSAPNAQAAAAGAPVDAEIQELITALTSGASEQELESIRELLRQANTGETRR